MPLNPTLNVLVATLQQYAPLLPGEEATEPSAKKRKADQDAPVQALACQALDLLGAELAKGEQADEELWTLLQPLRDTRNSPFASKLELLFFKHYPNAMEYWEKSILVEAEQQWGSFLGLVKELNESIGPSLEWERRLLIQALESGDLESFVSDLSFKASQVLGEAADHFKSPYLEYLCSRHNVELMVAPKPDHLVQLRAIQSWTPSLNRELRVGFRDRNMPNMVGYREHYTLFSTEKAEELISAAVEKITKCPEGPETLVLHPLDAVTFSKGVYHMGEKAGRQLADALKEAKPLKALVVDSLVAPHFIWLMLMEGIAKSDSLRQFTTQPCSAKDALKPNMLEAGLVQLFPNHSLTRLDLGLIYPSPRSLSTIKDFWDSHPNLRRLSFCLDDEEKALKQLPPWLKSGDQKLYMNMTGDLSYTEFYLEREGMAIV